MTAFENQIYIIGVHTNNETQFLKKAYAFITIMFI